MAKGRKTGGRKKGTPNQWSKQLKDAILEAVTIAGAGDMTNYLVTQATSNPTAFMTLLGKVLPLQVTGGNDSPIKFTFTLDHAGKGD